MGQATSSLTWCCCDREKRASAVLNDALKEKLLGDGEDQPTKTTHESPVAHSQSTSKHSSPRDADTSGSGMMPLGVESEDDGSDGRASRDRMDEEDDAAGDDGDGLSPRGAKPFRVKKQLSSSYRPSVNEWDLARESAFGVESVDAQLEQFPSDRSLEEIGRESMTRLARVTSDASNRDSYASARELLEATPEGDGEEDDPDEADEEEETDGGKDAAAQAAVLRRRQLPRPSSSRVFDDDVDTSRTSSHSSTSRGLRELAEQDGESEDFGSYSSGSSSMQSFLRRHSDIDSSGVSLVESVDLNDEPIPSSGESQAATVPKSGGRSPRHSGSKKKGKKRR